MADDHISLTLRTTLTLLRRRGVEPHPVFASTPSWHSEQALRQLDGEADEELRRLRMLDGQRLHRSLSSVLRALDRSSREYYGWIDTTVDGSPRSFAVLAAQAGEDAVVSVRDHISAVVVLAPVRGEELTEGFAAQIPPHPVARAASINTPYREFLKAPTQSRDSGTRALRTLFAAPRTGAGNLYCAVRTSGGRKRIKHPVNYIDTAAGRWLTVLDDAGGGWATATPATPGLIAGRLREAAEALEGSGGPGSLGDPRRK